MSDHYLIQGKFRKFKMNTLRATWVVACISLAATIAACSPKEASMSSVSNKNISNDAAISEPLSQEMEDAGKLLSSMNRAIDSIRRINLDFYEANLPSFKSCQNQINSALGGRSINDRVQTIRRCAREVADNRCWITGHKEQGSPECAELHRELRNHHTKEIVAQPEDVSPRENMEYIVANRCKGNPEYKECIALEEKLNKESEVEKRARRVALEKERMKNMMEVQNQCDDSENCPITSKPTQDSNQASEYL